MDRSGREGAVQTSDVRQVSAPAFISIYLVGATGGSYWPVVAWMALLCLITLVSVLVAAETFRGGEFASERPAGGRTVAEQG